MKKTFNRNSITIKLDSQYTWSEASDKYKYSAARTELKHDALIALLSSVNPVQEEYRLSHDDIELILKERNDIMNALYRVESILASARAK